MNQILSIQRNQDQKNIPNLLDNEISIDLNIEDPWDTVDKILLAREAQKNKNRRHGKCIELSSSGSKKEGFKEYSSKKVTTTSSRKSTQFSTFNKAATWMCSIYNTNYVAHMRSCVSSGTWVYEVGNIFTLFIPIWP